MIDNRLYDGWEVAKMLSEHKLEDGQQIRDNFGNEFEVEVVGVFSFLKDKKYCEECKVNVLTVSERKFYFV